MKNYALLACLLACLMLTSGCHPDELTPDDVADQIALCANGQGSSYFCNKAYVCKNGTIKVISKHKLARYLSYYPTAVHLEDNDGDGYVSRENECGLEYDCDDHDKNVNAGATEIENNGIDDDCNIDTADDACGTSETTYYTTAAEFTEVYGTLPTEVFEGSGTTTFQNVTCSSPVNSSQTNCFDAGLLIGGYSLSTTASNIQVNAGGLYPAAPSDNIGASGGSEDMVISFNANDITAVAFDISGIGDVVQIETYDQSNNLIDSKPVAIGTDNITYFAIGTAEPIGKIVINGGEEDFEFIDNLSFGSCNDQNI